MNWQLVPAVASCELLQNLVTGTKFWSWRLDFAAKKAASSQDATSIAGISPIVCADFKGCNTGNRKPLSVLKPRVKIKITAKPHHCKPLRPPPTSYTA